MSGKESALQASIKAYLLMSGYMVLRVNGGGCKYGKSYVPNYHWQASGIKSQTKGVSDLMAFGVSRFDDSPVSLFLENKRPGNIKGGSPEQKIFISELVERGFIAMFIDEFEDVVELLERINNGRE